MKLFLGIYLGYFLTSLIWIAVVFNKTDAEEKYVNRVTKRGKQTVNYKSVSLKVMNVDMNQGCSMLELLSNDHHSFEDDPPIVIKAIVPKNQIKVFKAKQAKQIEADLQVVINTRGNIPQVQTKVIRVY